MHENLTDFLSSPLTGTLIGVVTFLVSTALAVYLYYKARPFGRLEHASNDTIVLGTNNPIMSKDLEIRYRGKTIPRATGSVFAFWNSGNQTIRGDQIVPSDALRIELPSGSEILQAHVFAVTRPVIDAKVVIDASRRSASLTFDFLDNGDGFGIFVGHTGDPGFAKATGTIRGIKEGPLRRVGLKSPYSGLVWAMLPLVALLLALEFLPVKVLEKPLSDLLKLGVLTALTFLLLFGSLIERRFRLWSFPRDFRRNSVFSGVLPFLLDGRR